VARSYRRRMPAPPPWPPALTGRRGGLAEATSPPGLDLMWTKLRRPYGQGCSGKTTLLAQWRAAGGDRVAWMSLGEAENDPARCWT
jgi:hypothetical protein